MGGGVAPTPVPTVMNNRDLPNWKLVEIVPQPLETKGCPNARRNLEAPVPLTQGLCPRALAKGAIDAPDTRP